MLMRRRSVVAWLGGSALLFVAAALLLPFVGPSALDWSRVWQRQEPDWSILTNLRLSRTLLGLFAGGALALAGSLFQSMLRDALATPYTLGVSTGASLGAVIAIAFDWHMVAGVVGIWAGALAGAGLILFVVMGAATRGGQLSSSSLLLAGIAINSVCAALILLVHGLTGMSQSFAISRWLIGGLDAIERPTLLVYVLVVIGTGLIVIRQGRQWNLLAVGEAWAATRGAQVKRALFQGYVAGSILAATTVALDRTDRFRRPRRAASLERASRRRRPVADAVRVPARRRPAGVVRCPRTRAARPGRDSRRRDYRLHRRSTPDLGDSARRHAMTMFRTRVVRADGRAINVVQRRAHLSYCFTGCCCGRTERGYAAVPVDTFKDEWLRRKLRNVVHLTKAGCLGPCALANVASLVFDGRAVWFHSVNTPWHVRLIYDYIETMVRADRFVAPPSELTEYVFNYYDWDVRPRLEPSPGAAPQDAPSGQHIALLSHADTDLLALKRVQSALPTDLHVIGVSLVRLQTEEQLSLLLDGTLAPARVLVLRLHGELDSLPGFARLRAWAVERSASLVVVSGTGEPRADFARASTVGLDVVEASAPT